MEEQKDNDLLIIQLTFKKNGNMYIGSNMPIPEDVLRGCLQEGISCLENPQNPGVKRVPFGSVTMKEVLEETKTS